MRVLIAIDGSPVSKEVLAATAHLLNASDVLHIVTVVAPDEARETISSGPGPMHVEPSTMGTASGTVMPAGFARHVAAESATQAAERVHAQHVRELEQMASEVLPATLAWQVHVKASDDPAEAILRAADDLGVHGIAMGTRGRGVIAHALLGSVAEEVIRHANVPILVVRRGMQVPRPVGAAGAAAGGRN